MIYKITFNFRTAISYTEKPTFDSILAWCYIKDKYGIVEQKLSISENEMDSFDDLPLVRHKDGYFISSWIQYNDSKLINDKTSWKKRWANQHDHLADFNGKVKKVRINAGDYKSYDVPLELRKVKKAWFYFASEDVDRVRTLISKHLYGIGKKTAFGHGEIDTFEIEAIDFNPFEQVIRPIPIKKEDIKGNVRVRLMGFRPPYWLAENQTFCIIP